MEWLTESLVPESRAASRVFNESAVVIRVGGADGPN